MKSIYEEIDELKRQNDAVILAHYYVPDEVQKCADYVGDSFFLSRKDTELDVKTIVFAGVTFMGESAKILNPQKTVLIPDETADCPMAAMASIEKIEKMREEYEDLAVVCYINSSAEMKTHADVCVTSSNALDIVKNLPNKNIFFIPDKNLGSYVAKHVPEKNVILNDGYCYVHDHVTVEQVKEIKNLKPEAEFLVHPESSKEVLAYADYVGSTAGIIKYASESDKKEFIIGTEGGVLYELREKNPDKVFYTIKGGQTCTSMKKITLEKIRDCMKNHTGKVQIESDFRERAQKPLTRMLNAAK